jgi:hypothetical protein
MTNKDVRSEPGLGGSEPVSHFHRRPGRAESLEFDGRTILPANCPTARARGSRNTASSAAIPGHRHCRPGVTVTVTVTAGPSPTRNPSRRTSRADHDDRRPSAPDPRPTRWPAPCLPPHTVTGRVPGPTSGFLPTYDVVGIPTMSYLPDVAYDVVGQDLRCRMCTTVTS